MLDVQLLKPSKNTVSLRSASSVSVWLALPIAYKLAGLMTTISI